MDLRDFLIDVAQNYDRHAGLNTPTQELLRGSSAELEEHAPAGIEVHGSGGVGMATLTPWVGFFDPAETSTPQDGLFVCYFFSEDLRSVYLTLVQGFTKLRNQFGGGPARRRLADAGTLIRSGLADWHGLATTMDLGSRGPLQQAYSAGCVVSRR